MSFCNSLFSIVTSCLLFALVTACSSPEVIHDLSDASFSVINQDSAAVNFPQDFKGDYVIAAFIYTHCPDICRITTANMKNISKQLEDTTNVEFVEITFDPKRDTPSALKKYMQTYKLNPTQFTMLTGEPVVIDSLMSQVGIQAAVSYVDTTQSGDVQYTMNHTDRILIMDPQGRVRFQYPGSMVPPKNVIEDLNKLR